MASFVAHVRRISASRGVPTVVGGMALVYLAGPGFLLLGVASRWLHRHGAGVRREHPERPAALGLLAVLFAVLAQQCYSRWARPLVRCAVLGCLTPPSDADVAEDSDIVVSGLPNSVGLALFIVCTLAAVGEATLVYLALTAAPPPAAAIPPVPASRVPAAVPWGRPGSCSWWLSSLAVLLLLVPALVFVSTALPLWQQFTPTGIAAWATKEVSHDWTGSKSQRRLEEGPGPPDTKGVCGKDFAVMCPELPHAFMTTFTVEISDGILLKFFPDVVLYFCFIYLVVLVAFAGRVFAPVQ